MVTRKGHEALRARKVPTMACNQQHSVKGGIDTVEASVVSSSGKVGSFHKGYFVASGESLSISTIKVDHHQRGNKEEEGLNGTCTTCSPVNLYWRFQVASGCSC